MIKNLKIRAKLTIGFLLVVEVLILITGYLTYVTAKGHLLNLTFNELATLTTARAVHLEEFLSHSRGRAIDFASDGLIDTLTLQLLTRPSEVVRNRLNEHLRKNKMSLDETIYGISIVNLDGKVIASTMADELGQDEADHDYFLEAKKLNYGQAYLGDIALAHHFHSDRPAFAVAAPLWNRTDGEKLLGVIINYIKTDEFGAVVSGMQKSIVENNLQHTGAVQTYLTDKDGVLLSPTRSLPEEAVLHQQIDTPPTKSCTRGLRLRGIYPDYRGVSVVGTSVCFRNGWTLIGELSIIDAFAPLKRMEKDFLSIALATVFGAMVLVYVSVRKMTSPLRDFALAVEDVSKGNFARRIQLRRRDELGQLADAFNHMAEALSKIDRAKTEFVSMASHQLRTPLSVIRWFTELLLSGNAGKPTKKQKAYLEEVYRGNMRMIELVNALLNVSRIDVGSFTMEMKPVVLKSIIEDVVAEFELEMKAKRLKFKADYDSVPTVNADPKFVRIVFQNLFSNAVKYTPAKGNITVRLTRDDSFVLAAVSDTGYGIPKESQAKLFTKLFRADNVREKDPAGTGLGLYIAKAIVEQSKGSIWFESEENHGSTFFVRLPVAATVKKLPSSPRDIVAGKRKKRQVYEEKK